MNRRFFIRINAECGDPILELRDRALQEGSQLIAEFYPHGWANPRYEIEKLAARLNGEAEPTPEQFASDRMDEFDQRLKALEGFELRIVKLEQRRRRPTPPSPEVLPDHSIG